MKKLLDPLTTAWVGIVTHKLRSILTILGVVIGVAAVIALMSVGKGATQSILSRFSSLGANSLFISPGFAQQTGAGANVRQNFGSANSLTLDDANAIASSINNVSYVAPSSNTSVQAIAGNQNMRATVTGVTPEYQQVYNIKLAEGDFITADDNNSRARVAVIGATVATTLFPDSDPVGQVMRAGNYIVNIIGVAQAGGQSITGTADDSIIVPLNTLQILGGQSRTSSGAYVLRSIGVQVTDSKYSAQATADITALLEVRHNIPAGGNDDFRITSVEALLTSLGAVTTQLTLLLGAIAAISLVVGGIGVMNIMLVSVMERTREIGIRKALGAKGRDIWGQFLIEAAMLTFTGGLIGVAFGWVAAYFVNKSGTVPAIVTADVVILAVSVSIGIGLFFGFYPAWQASRLRPIEALRAE